MIKLLFLFIVLLNGLSLSANDSNRGVLIWFYSLDTKTDKKSANMLYFKQTAGVTDSKQIVNNILPLSPQSYITKEKDDNWYLNLSSNKIVINNKRALFLGQVLDFTTSDTIYIKISKKHNIYVNKLKYKTSLNKYLLDRDDLNINHPLITNKRDELLKKAPKILDYLIAVDKYVHQQFRYEKPIRPNKAKDLLFVNNAWCGEYNKLKQSLLRSAGIPTRDVYVAKTGKDGPSIDAVESSGIHVWLEVYISDEIGWVIMPSTRKLKKNYNFVKFQAGYYIRALDLYQYKKEIQRKRYTYNALKRNGGIRGNGMYFEISTKYFKPIQAITSEILNYNKIPSRNIIKKIEKLPQKVRPLLYWFLISVPDRYINTKATKLFLNSLKKQPLQKLERYYVISPTLVKNRIDAQRKMLKVN